MYLVVEILEEGLYRYYLPLDQYKQHNIKGASIIGSDEPLVSTRLKEVVGNKKLAAKCLCGSTTVDIYKANNYTIK